MTSCRNSDDGEDSAETISFQFKRKSPIVERDDDDENSYSNSLANSQGSKTRIDEDGTEYEWDDKIHGWFPKVTERYLVEHHMNYGLDNNVYKFNADKSCYTYELEDGSLLRLEPTTNQWIPFDAAIVNDKDELTFMHPQLKIQFILRSGKWEPATQSSYSDERSGIVYLWSRQHNAFVDSRLLNEYIDVVTEIHYKWNEDRWQIIQPPIAGKGSKSEIDVAKSKTTCETTQQGWADVPDEKNRNVYISNLPTDMDYDEFYELMSKYGLIAIDPDNKNKPRIKLYKDANGQIKGDGLCTFAKVESVDLCLNILDGLVIRDKSINAQRAQFQLRGEFDPTRKRKRRDKKKAFGHLLTFGLQSSITLRTTNIRSVLGLSSSVFSSSQPNKNSYMLMA
ncbi:hypothetical protein GJ496_004293 [Pomphorhynchus laevis]|nr:hypothetical protein GJ496_004293 [Pomphorhynchus laevis]